MKIIDGQFRLPYAGKFWGESLIPICICGRQVRKEVLLLRWQAQVSYVLLIIQKVSSGLNHIPSTAIYATAIPGTSKISCNFGPRFKFLEFAIDISSRVSYLDIPNFFLQRPVKSELSFSYTPTDNWETGTEKLHKHLHFGEKQNSIAVPGPWQFRNPGRPMFPGLFILGTQTVCLFVCFYLIRACFCSLEITLPVHCFPWLSAQTSGCPLISTLLGHFWR